jgi:hypothetical protein
MAKQNVTKTNLQCCECESEAAAEGEKFEIEVFRYSRHGVGVAHVGRLCESCFALKGMLFAAEA